MNRRAARAGGSLPASSRKLRFRRADTVVSYWLARVLVFENYLAHTRISGDPLLASILHFCSVPRTLPELAAEYPEVSANELRQGVRNLLRYALLELYPPSQSKYAGSFEAWESWRPSAAYFHFSTRDMQYPKTKVDDFTGLRRIAKEHRLPPMQKKYPRAGKIFLPAPRMKGEFASVCKQRRTWREFSPAPVDLQCLSELLWLSFGIQGWALVPGVGRLALTTSPSGGCLHPLEAYVLARKVSGLRPAIYHYDRGSHRLARLRKGVSKRAVSKFLGEQEWFGDAAVVVFLTAVFERTQWKYDHPRAYRVVLAEMGHVCQTFCLTATWLGLAPFCTMALADSQIERALEVDGVGESVLYAMGAGHRPSRAATVDRFRVEKNPRASKTKPR